MNSNFADRINHQEGPATMTITPADIFAEVNDSLAPIFERIDIAEEEIAAAQKRHPQASDALWHSFCLLTPTHERMETEMVFRSHCRELLDRVATGADTRPGTAAEVCCVLRDVTLMTPIRSTAAGLYFRAWLAAGFPDVADIGEASRRHEALEASRIDDHEQHTRAKLADPNRHLADVECRGLHHGEPVDCTFASDPAIANAIFSVAEKDGRNPGESSRSAL